MTSQSDGNNNGSVAYLCFVLMPVCVCVFTGGSFLIFNQANLNATMTISVVNSVFSANTVELFNTDVICLPTQSGANNNGSIHCILLCVSFSDCFSGGGGILVVAVVAYALTFSTSLVNSLFSFNTALISNNTVLCEPGNIGNFNGGSGGSTYLLSLPNRC